MNYSLAVIGAGGFGREALDVAEAMVRAKSGPRSIVAIDDSPTDRNLSLLARRHISYIGTLEDWLQQPERNTDRYVVAIGEPSVRESLVERVDQFERVAATLVHPSTLIGSFSFIAPGSIICAGVNISTNVQLGRHVHLNPGVTIGHDTMIDPYTSVNPGAVISGECQIGRGALIGANSTVLQQLTLGTGSAVGAGAVVTRNVAPRTTVTGVPARPVKYRNERRAQ